MAEVMQIEPLRGDIGTEQHPHRIVFATKAIHQLLLLGVGHATVQDFQLSCPQARRLGQGVLQPAQGFNALGKYNHAVCWIGWLPVELHALDVLYQTLELTEAGGVNLAQTDGEF